MLWNLHGFAARRGSWRWLSPLPSLPALAAAPTPLYSGASQGRSPGTIAWMAATRAMSPAAIQTCQATALMASASHMAPPSVITAMTTVVTVMTAPAIDQLRSAGRLLSQICSATKPSRTMSSAARASTPQPLPILPLKRMMVRLTIAVSRVAIPSQRKKKSRSFIRFSW